MIAWHPRKMATCTICGNDVSPITVGTQTNLCADCQYKTEKTPAALIPQISTQSGEKSIALRAPLTKILVGLNVAVFAAMVLNGVSFLEPTTKDLVRWGADWGPLTLTTQPWRLLTSNYLHVGIIHLFFNMWCLLNLGALAERILDRKTYVLIYTLCGLAGSCVSAWWHPEVVGAGASGAIFGLAGALLAALYLGKLPVSRDAIRPTLKSLLSFAGWNLFLGLRAGVDNSAHLGGLIAGLILGATFSKFLTADEDQRGGVRNLVALSGTLVLVLAFVSIRHEHKFPTKPGITPEAYFAESHRFPAAAANRKEGEAFLAANRSKEGVIALPDGLQYRVLFEGKGQKPNEDDLVTVTYRGTLVNGTEFDSSYKHGHAVTLPVNKVIKGWTEALQLMPVGSKWQLFIPADLAYGDRGAGRDIAPGATLIFEVELLSIHKQK